MMASDGGAKMSGSPGNHQVIKRHCLLQEQKICVQHFRIHSSSRDTSLHTLNLAAVGSR